MNALEYGVNMPTLILSSRYTSDSQRLWRTAHELGWNVERLQNWRLPDKPLFDPVLYVESLFTPMIADQLGIIANEPPDDWLVRLPEEFRKREILLTTFEDAKKHLPCFVKPPNDKSFAAKVYDKLPEYIEGNISVLVQESVEWEKEFRCFALNGKVLTLSVYLRHGLLQKDEDWYSSFPEKQEAVAFAESVLQSVETPKAIVIDVGVIKDRGWAAIELNAAWGSGLYGCNEKQALEVIRYSQNQVYENIP
jgi:hypothetical protein